MKKIIKGFQPLGGKHCITNSLKQIFSFYGYPLSEQMLFGLGEGLDFTYINLAHSPMVSGRSKILEFEEVLSKRLGIEIKCKMSKDNDKILKTTKDMLNNNQPVLAYVDMPYLPYLSLSENSHFGGHAVVLFGYDDEQTCFFVSDRDNANCPVKTPQGTIAEDYHLVSYEQMEMARSSSFRPFPANNKYITFNFENFQGIDNINLVNAILAVCDKMLCPQPNLKEFMVLKNLQKKLLNGHLLIVPK